jgi:[ribosomal protein S18]-alanine N-acetyltransferase
LRDVPLKPQTAEVKFRLRDYRAADFERLWQIDQLCFPQGISYTQMELSGFVTRRNAVTLVAEADELFSNHEVLAPTGFHSGELRAAVEPYETAGGTQKIAGFIIAHAVRGKTGRILTLDIVPKARRLGLASLLMDECEHRLRLCGCKEMYLETAVDNEPALQLYRKFGYQVLRTLPGYYATHSLDAFLMGKAL